MSKQMLAFHNDIKIKQKYLTRVIEHAEADRLVKGATGGDGKGCAVACTLDMVYDHSRYPIELGIPEWLARLEDTLFEGSSDEFSQGWPQKFLAAIHPGADLEKAKTPFLIFVLESTLESMAKAKFDADKFPDVAKALEGSTDAIKEMIRCHHEGLDLSAAGSAAWSAAESAAGSARSAAGSARSAAGSARSAAGSAWSAAWSARSAAGSAWSAARSAAESAAGSARSAAESAAGSAGSARSARSAAGSARSAANETYANKLLEILSSIKPEEQS